MAHSKHSARPPHRDPLFEHGGELGERMRNFDWAATPLGPPDAWPVELRTYVYLMLTSKQPMYLAWTHDLIALYNDAYRPILGADKHPRALGARTADIFGEAGYPLLKPVFDAVLRGESHAFENLLVPLVRRGFMEEAYFDVSYSPVYVGSRVAGSFSTVNETTDRVLAARRTQTLAALTASLLGESDALRVAQAAARVAEQNPHDLPLLTLHLPGEHGEWALCASAGTDDLNGTPSFLPGDSADTSAAVVVSAAPLRAGPWSEPVRELARLPLVQPDGSTLLGWLVVGLNPRKPLDDAYRDFLHLFSGQVAAALNSARLTEALQLRNAELAARTRALEAFADLTRDLTLHHEPHGLVRIAQQVVLSMLPEGYAVYAERDGRTWRLKVQTGDLRQPELQRVADAGLPYATTRNFYLPWTTREAYYQDHYDPNTDELNGLARHVGATAVLPVLANGEPVGVFGVALFEPRVWSDVDKAVLESVVRSLGVAVERARSVRQLAEQRGSLAEQREELTVANEELEAFAYSVSHDLRSPVRHIGGYTALLRKRLRDHDDETVGRYLGVIDEAAGRMNTLIDALLDLSRTSRLPVRFGPVDLASLAKSVGEELAADVLERNVTWKIQALPLVQGDHDLLRQVLLNLLENALKYTRTRDEAVIEVWAEDRPGEVAVFMRDNGVGFDPRYQDKLFGVFQRLHRAEEFEGTGVGLATVRRIVTRHGGTVSAEGQPGAGATFGFTLPK